MPVYVLIGRYPPPASLPAPASLLGHQPAPTFNQLSPPPARGPVWHLRPRLPLSVATPASHLRPRVLSAHNRLNAYPGHAHCPFLHLRPEAALHAHDAARVPHRRPQSTHMRQPDSHIRGRPPAISAPSRRVSAPAHTRIRAPSPAIQAPTTFHSFFPALPRALTQGSRCAQPHFYNKWFIMRDEFVRDFWREFDEEEYAGDVLKLGWRQWVLRGYKGFKLTKEEAENGICAAEFMNGLVVDEEAGTFKWIQNSLQPVDTQLTALEGNCLTMSPKSTATLQRGPLPGKKHQRAARRNVPNPMIVRRSSPPTTSALPAVEKHALQLNTVAEAQREPPGVRTKSPEAAYLTPSPSPTTTARRDERAGTKLGCAAYPGHPTDAFKAILEARKNVIVVEDDDDGMQGIEVMPGAHCMVGDADRMQTRGDMDEEEELQLLYPGASPVTPGARANGDSALILNLAQPVSTLSGGADGSSTTSQTAALVVAANDVPSSHQLVRTRYLERQLVGPYPARTRKALTGDDELRRLRPEARKLRAQTHMFDSSAHRHAPRLNARHPLEHLIAGDDMDLQVDFPAQIHMDFDGTALEAIGEQDAIGVVKYTPRSLR
ncbi:hypothetical protein C8R44DRAFT_865225 [Mycena epipterygia]|nr:hypothetical protein C8R44DRAFT_865225 [Mycena epipterygia]